MTEAIGQTKVATWAISLAAGTKNTRMILKVMVLPNFPIFVSRVIYCLDVQVIQLKHNNQVRTIAKQGCSHAFESEEAQSPKAILGSFCLKKWEGPSLLLLLYGQKSGGAKAPRAP